MISRRDTSILVIVLLALLVLAAVLWSVPAGAQVPAQSAIIETTLPVTLDTQSGNVFVDGAGHVFVVGRYRSHLVVYRDGVPVMEQNEAYSAPDGYIGPDGMLYVSAVDNGNRRLWRRYLVPEWTPVSFVSRAATLGQVNR